MTTNGSAVRSSAAEAGFRAGFHQRLQLLTRMKRDDTARGNRNRFAGLRIAARALRFVAQLEVAEARQLHAVAAFERVANDFEESFDHVFRFALVESDVVEQHLGQFGFRERRRLVGRRAIRSRDISDHGAALRRKKGFEITRVHLVHIRKMA